MTLRIGLVFFVAWLLGIVSGLIIDMGVTA